MVKIVPHLWYSTEAEAAAGFRRLARHGAGPWDFDAEASLALE